jgi:hypothetical protein
MHEFLHIIGLCPDNFTHFDLSDLVVANYQNLSYININTIKYYVTKCISSRGASTNE